jgi:hypothetical protein
MLKVYTFENKEYGVIIKRGLWPFNNYSLLFIKPDEYFKFEKELTKTLNLKYSKLFEVMNDLEDMGFTTLVVENNESYDPFLYNHL